LREPRIEPLERIEVTWLEAASTLMSGYEYLLFTELFSMFVDYLIDLTSASTFSLKRDFEFMLVAELIPLI